MKRLFAAALLFAAVLPAQLRAQTITATYTTTHLKNQVDAVFTGEMDEKDSYKDKSTQPPTIYKYIYSSGKSLTTMTDDGGFSKSSDPAKKYTVIAPTTEIHFKDAAKNRYHIEWIINDKLESHVGELINYNWKITKEKATIAGYKCIKATGTLSGHTVTAWFAKDLKANDGPARFSGLPGLILKVSLDDLYEIEASNIAVMETSTEITEPVAQTTTKQF